MNAWDHLRVSKFASPLLEALVANINARLASKALPSIAELARRSKLDDKTLRRIVDKKNEPALNTVTAIAIAMGVEPWKVFAPLTDEKKQHQAPESDRNFSPGGDSSVLNSFPSDILLRLQQATPDEIGTVERVLRGLFDLQAPNSEPRRPGPRPRLSFPEYDEEDDGDSNEDHGVSRRSAG
ncbi:hypothetical protein AVMA1855_20150 [Acidovorax sp. SUPP1855]|uniref:hypothetical protein n=1 Tax=Acidovorax sp. SUPP1855 TaxID=431774 RepID=UPI0023DE62A4|nr:hypothetical protein [Acidovorax sp. SUPP1855]GKS86504.1 hypothetical protein AVMA1855_20150 [Acidovorax sp. SUPP1855]